MKKKLLFVGLFLYCSTAFCRTNDKQDLSAILTLKPYGSTLEDVRNVLSDLIKKDSIKEKSAWSYNLSSGHLIIYWDTRVGQIQKYNFIGVNRKKIDFDSEAGCHFEIGKSKVLDILSALGDPNDIISEPDHQSLHYAFNNTDIVLDFCKGALARYNVRALKP